MSTHWTMAPTRMQLPTPIFFLSRLACKRRHEQEQTAGTTDGMATQWVVDNGMHDGTTPLSSLFLTAPSTKEWRTAHAWPAPTRSHSKNSSAPLR
jgi:uncharacterized protein (DUF1684 family)